MSAKVRVRLEESFDSAFYVGHYRDLSAFAGPNHHVAALQHFAFVGASEGRDPCPSFQTGLYLRLFPEARRDRDGAYFHYLRLPDAERARRRSLMAEWRGPTGRAPAFYRYGAANGVFVVVHEGYRSGAPLIALNLVRTLAREYRLPVVTILLNRSGPLVADFERDSVEVIAFDAILKSKGGDPKRTWDEVAQRLVARRIAFGICNSIVTSDAIESLAGRGLRCISLVHELPTSITGYGWERHAENINNFASVVVFPSNVVREEFSTSFGEPRGTTRILNQPSNIDVEAFEPAALHQARHRMRRALGIADEDFVVLSVGNGDFRKGVDLYLQTISSALERSRKKRRRLCFVWLGDVPSHVGVWIRRDLEKRGWADRVYLAGAQQERVAEYYAAADVFFLPSREDPFPTVVLEALHAGLPVVGFDGSGGVIEQVGESAGRLVPYGDWAQAADLLVKLSSTDLGKMRAAAVARATSFGSSEQYAADLLNLLQFGATQRERQESRPRTALVGAGVPAYRCAEFLEERIWSVFEQTLAPAEIFMIDDASPDATAEVMHRVKAFAPS